MVKKPIVVGSGCVAALLSGLATLGCDVETQDDERMETAAGYTLAMESLSNWGRWGDDDEFGAANFISG